MAREPRTASSFRSRPIRGVLLGIVALGLLAGCGADSRSGDEDSASEAPAEGGSVGSASQDAAGGEDAVTARATNFPEGAEQVDDVEQQIIYTGSITLRVDDRREAAEQATAIAEEHGGNRFSLEADLEGEGDSTLVLKVEPDEFDAAMEALAELGRPRNTKVDQENVTDQVVDVQGRLETANRSAERLRELLTGADDVNAIVAVEQELARRESEIESLEGQLRVLESQTSMATITLTLTERGEAKVDEDIPGFGTGLSRGFVAVVTVLAVGLTVLGFLLPFLLVLSPFVAGWWFWRKRHPKQPKPKPSPAPAMYWDGTQWRQTATPTPATVGASAAGPATPSTTETRSGPDSPSSADAPPSPSSEAKGDRDVPS
jgi:hypothetical protein